MAKGKRVKADKDVLLPIKDWDQADDYIRRVGDLQRQIEQTEAEATDHINKIKNRCKDKVERLRDKQSLHTRSLQAFADDHREEFGKAQSKSFVFGKLGWRRSKSINIKKLTLELIKAIFGPAKQKQLIKTKETVNKTALAKLTDEELAKVEARRVDKEVFFVEPLVVNVKDDDDDARLRSQVGDQQ